jgi:hypothetical protein
VLGFHDIYSTVRPKEKTESYSLGNGRRITNNQAEAFEFCLKRDFPNINFKDGQQVISQKKINRYSYVAKDLFAMITTSKLDSNFWQPYPKVYEVFGAKRKD